MLQNAHATVTAYKPVSTTRGPAFVAVLDVITLTGPYRLSLLSKNDKSMVSQSSRADSPTGTAPLADPKQVPFLWDFPD
jgi:hypothetical protein